MPEIHIPKLGDKLTLRRPWKFKMLMEHRNAIFAADLGLIAPIKSVWDFEMDLRKTMKRGEERGKWDVELPYGTELIVDRVYIRKGGSEFDSVSFFVHAPRPAGCSGKGKKRRFFASLDDVNRIIGEWENQYSAPTEPLTSLTIEELDHRLHALEAHIARIHEARREIINRTGANGTRNIER